MKNNWKTLFINQTSSGKFWKNLFGKDFDTHKFLDRSDAVSICKQAQADVYENIMTKLEGKVDISIINELKKDLADHWKNDDSALGLK